MSNIEGLLPCPFCGGRAEVDCRADGGRIRCSICGISTIYYEDTPTSYARGGMGDSRDYHIAHEGTYGIYLAVNAWNKRV